MATRREWPEVIPITEATGQFLSPDTTETKRIDFTEFFLRFRHAEDADAAYKHVFTTSQQLIKLLVDHPAMKPNLEQTFSTPANSKNKVYFMWDFVLRTFQFLAAQVDPRHPWESQMWEDVMSRSLQAKLQVHDTSGKLEQANASIGYNDDAGVEFGDEIKAVAAKLDELPGGCEGCGRPQRANGNALLACSKCKEARYCSTQCQRSCWKEHKKVCAAA